MNTNFLSQLDPQDTEQMNLMAHGIIQKMAEEKKTLQEVLEINDSLLDKMYHLAYSYYDQGKYSESQSLFFFLCGVAPSNYRFVFGLAASYHQLEAFEEAALGFFSALHLAPQNPISAYYAADCFIKLENKEAALEFLSIAIDIAANNPEFATLKERCKLIKKSII